MKKHNDATIVIANVMILAAAILLASHAAHGQGGQPNQVPQPVNVKVVNTPAEPVPVAGTVNVSNLGAAPLPVTGTVTVSNLGSSTVLIREAPKNVFRWSNDFSITASGTADICDFAVPAGKQLVIEQMSVVAEGCRGLRAAIQTGPVFNQHQYWIVGEQKLIDSIDTWIASSQMRSYSNGGTVEIFVGRSNVGAACSGRIYVSGYLVDLP